MFALSGKHLTRRVLLACTYIIKYTCFSEPIAERVSEGVYKHGTLLTITFCYCRRRYTDPENQKVVKTLITETKGQDCTISTTHDQGISKCMWIIIYTTIVHILLESFT